MTVADDRRLAAGGALDGRGRAALVDHDRVPAAGRRAVPGRAPTSSPHPSYGPLIIALALAGIGIGTTLVPITSSVLCAVPAERSGMAASATNTSREIGAVTGVAILGSLVYSQLHASLVAQMNHLGVPASFQGLVINAIETGAIPKNTKLRGVRASSSRRSSAPPTRRSTDGLHAALYLSAGWRWPPGCSP